MTTLEIKRQIRTRDGMKCRKCGIGQAAHIEKHGKGLEVHRIVPGSEYTLEGCVTLCKVCHGYAPRGPRRQITKRQSKLLRIPLGAALLASVRSHAARFHISVGDFIRMATSVRLESDEATAPKKRNGH